MRSLTIGLILTAVLASGCASDSARTVDPIAQPAVTDLAGRLGIEESEIAVVSIEEVTWPDGSLGCPEPGTMYTQALEDGTLIILEVDGATYEYHAGVDRDPFYCDAPTPPVP